MDKPNYYAILPATVRYSSDIRPMAKLLFAEITALSNKDGYCTATNKYLSNCYDVSTRTINNSLEDLKVNGFIKVDVVKNATGTWRKIYPLMDIQGVATNKHLQENSTPYEEKCKGGVSESATQRNSTRNNIATTTKAIWSIEDIKNHIRSEYSTDWTKLSTMVEQQTFLAVPLDICREGLASFMTKCDAKTKIDSPQQLEKELAEWIRKEYKFSKLAATKKKSRTIPNGRPNSKTRDIQYIQNAKDTLLRVRGELVGNNTIQALEQKDIFVKNEQQYLNKLDHLTNIKIEYFKDNDCISEYFLFDLLYSNTFHYLRKSFRVIGDNVEDHILVKGTINKFKKKLFNELSDYNQSKGDIYKLAYKHHKKTQL